MDAVPDPDVVPAPSIDVNNNAVPAPSIDERMAMTAAKLDADFSKVVAKIHRFPTGLRGIGGDNNRYIVPSVVAIGPYHHGLPHLQKMEEVKLAAAYHLFGDTRFTGAQVYEMVRSYVGGEASRGCYDTDDPAVRRLSDAEFADMMFLDGCFLLQYMVASAGDGDGDYYDNTTAFSMLQNRMALSTGPSIQKDIFLMENQIPWLVLDALAKIVHVDLLGFLASMGDKFHPRRRRRRWMLQYYCRCIIPAVPAQREDVESTGNMSPPPHLLGLLRFTQLGSMPDHVKNYSGVSSSLTTSAVELEQMGIKLTARPEEGFGATRVRRGLLFGELSLSPVFLNDVTACWFVNIAAAEASISGTNRGSDSFVVSSYLSVLAMLMDREEDVQQLREKHILYSTFTNSQTLGFFKRLVHYLPVGRFYFALLEDIEAYERSRAPQIFLYRLLYNSFKTMTIATLFSIVGVLVGIFKTLLDNKNKGAAP